jgi:MerR family transcriptional regulator, light-induced transcriptional regulator
MNIAALSRRTGVAPDTLRKWEQRYGILRPKRTGGGQRRYSELDVARVEWLRARLAEGYRIGEAAALLGGTSGEISTDPTELREAMLAAIREADQARLGNLLDQAFALHPVERALDEIVHPVLVAVGEGWERGELSVADEHLATGTMRAHLERLLADARGGVRGVAVLACAPGELHELGLLMLGVLLRADGWQVAYLGADTPTADAVELVERLSAQVLAVSMAMPERVEGLRGLEVPRGVRLVVGGSAASPEVAAELGAEHVDSSLGAAGEHLRRAAVPA